MCVCVCVCVCVCISMWVVCVHVHVNFGHMFLNNNSAPYLKVWVTPLEYLLFGERFLPPTLAHQY